MKVTLVKESADAEFVVIDNIGYIRLSSDYWVYPDTSRGQITDPRQIEQLEAAYQNYVNPKWRIYIERENTNYTLWVTIAKWHLSAGIYVTRQDAEEAKERLESALNSLIEE